MNNPQAIDTYGCTVEQVDSFVKQIESAYLLDRPRKNGSERREVERLTVTMPVEITPLDEHQQPLSYQLNAITRDLSSKGVGLVATSPVAQEFVLLTFQPFQGNSFHVLAKVVYSNDLGYYFQVGCEFQVS